MRITDIPGITYDRLSIFCRQKVKETIEEGSDGEPDEYMIELGTAPEASNYSVFMFDGKTVTVYFQQYQVAPYSFGIISIGFVPGDLNSAPVQKTPFKNRPAIKN